MTKRASTEISSLTKLESCAAAVESVIRTTGVELTMGGEPTYVPLRPDGPEWSVDAIGPTKLDFARKLAARVMRRHIPGAVTLETSGKHYPGEPVPRWCLQVQWRADPKAPALWRDATLLCASDEPRGPHKLADARKLMRAIATSVRARGCVLPLVEPSGGTPVTSGGFVLPLEVRDGEWASQRWPVVDKKVVLVPGDSWLGLRLPLGSLPPKGLRCALTIEVRSGSLIIFIPPLRFEAYARLLGIIEQALVRLKLSPVALVGYAPPAKGQYCSLGFSSDPGVLEVNLPACATWKEYVGWLKRMDVAARGVGLCARKFRYNGQISGTGGGAHLCFGGPQPARSPFFERPDFLPSILRYWQHHPALSYAFSGFYLGPGSQAPRVDESQPSILNELELACRGAEGVSRPIEVILLNRLFRDLLVDRGGNTHRAEVCIDKLWNTGPANGRSGIVEFRAFEMLPGVGDMSAIALFVRAILARLLARPYARAVRDWGAALHDRFFLPSVLWDDVIAVAADLRAAGMPFDEAWLRPAWEFRFPALGRLTAGSGEIVFRQALEAWPVMSEQPMGSATARSVDSSMDRLEVSVADETMAMGGVLLVNGHPIPLRPVGGRWLAGIRYRAFFLHAGLHPHIPAHSPMTLEWVEVKSRRVVSAARWHTWNPRGGDYAGVPGTERAARRRSAARWETVTPGGGRKSSGNLRAARCRPRNRLTVDLRHCVAPTAAK